MEEYIFMNKDIWWGRKNAGQNKHNNDPYIDSCNVDPHDDQYDDDC